MSSNYRYIVIIGETGSGKSTFINYLANYFNRGKFENPKIAIPTRFHAANMNFEHLEVAVDDVTKSKTAECHDYAFELEEVEFRFVDTPGINDTGGHLQDSRNVDNILVHIQHETHMNALILVLNGALSRATVNVRNVLATFKDRLPDVFYNNLFVVLTNCQSHTANFNPLDLGLPQQCPVFHMQNSAFSSDPTRWSAYTRGIMENEFLASMQTINNIIVHICKLNPQSTDSLKNMSDDRNQIKRELHDARMMIMDLQQLEDQLVAFELTADLHSSNAEKFRDFIKCKDVITFVRVQTLYHNTTCARCSSTCHENCGLNEVPRTGNNMFMLCSAMSSGFCIKCPGHCAAKHHYHNRTVLVPQRQTIIEVVASIEKRCKEAEEGKRNANKKCNDIHETKKFIETELQAQYSKLKETVKRLRRTCSSFNISNELIDFIIDLKKDIKLLRNESVVQKAEAFIAKLEALCQEPGNGTFMPSSLGIQASGQPRPLSPQQSLGNQSTPLKKDSRRQKTCVANKNEVAEYENPLIPATTSSTTDAYLGDDLNRKTACCISEKHTEYDGSNSRESRQKSNVTEQQWYTAKDLDKQAKLQKTTVDRQISETGNGVVATTQQMPEKKTDTSLKLDYKSLSLTDLINESKSDKGKEMRAELNRRSCGTSLGLLTLADQLLLCEQFAQLRPTHVRELVRLCEQLQEEIREETENDPFEIERVPHEKLLRLAAIKLLLLPVPT